MQSHHVYCAQRSRPCSKVFVKAPHPGNECAFMSDLLQALVYRVGCTVEKLTGLLFEETKTGEGYISQKSSHRHRMPVTTADQGLPENFIQCNRFPTNAGPRNPFHCPINPRGEYVYTILSKSIPCSAWGTLSLTSLRDINLTYFRYGTLCSCRHVFSRKVVYHPTIPFMSA